jgi:hypothetical protein
LKIFAAQKIKKFKEFAVQKIKKFKEVKVKVVLPEHHLRPVRVKPKYFLPLPLKVFLPMYDAHSFLRALLLFHKDLR